MILSYIINGDKVMKNKTANRLSMVWAAFVVALALIAFILGYKPIGGWQVIDVILVVMFAVMPPLIFLGWNINKTTILQWKTGNPTTQAYARELASVAWEVLHIGVFNVRGEGYIDTALGKELREKIRASRPLFERLRRVVLQYPYYGKIGSELSGVMLELKELLADRTVRILFRPAHPSIETLFTLAPGNIINLHYQVKPMTCALPFELCAYLKVEKAVPAEPSVN